MRRESLINKINEMLIRAFCIERVKDTVIVGALDLKDLAKTFIVKRVNTSDLSRSIDLRLGAM